MGAIRDTTKGLVACLSGLVWTLAAAGAADVTPAPASKAPSAFVPAADGWQSQFTLYGWATGLNGDVGVRGLPPAHVDVSAVDAIKNLDGALMGSFASQRGDWTFLVDLIYADLSESVPYRRLGGVSASIDVKQTIVQGLAGYRLPLALGDNVDLSGTVGFRYQHLSSAFDVFSTSAPITLGTSGTRDWIDPTVGLFLNYRINDKWFVNALADIGGFGVSSRLTAQGFAAVGYMWTPSISTAVGYRAIYTDYENSGFVYDVTQHGVFVSAAYHF